MNNIVTQMAAISAAMRMLLAGDQIVKPRNLLIAAASGLTNQLIETMMSHAASKRSTFLAMFQIQGNAAYLEKVLVVDASTTKGEINIGAGKFIQKPDDTFAILSLNREQPYQYALRNSGRRLVRSPADIQGDRALMEFRGLQALLSKAATSECQREAFQRAVYPY
ncbi:MAG TPA: hypothetical protein VF662_06685 [Allosphingosinicella sp.]|jgi:hypothetical protein